MRTSDSLKKSPGTAAGHAPSDGPEPPAADAPASGSEPSTSAAGPRSESVTSGSGTSTSAAGPRSGPASSGPPSRARPRARPGATEAAAASSGAAGPTPEAETAFYVRVTALVTLGVGLGALLEWLPGEPSPWRWLPLGVAYLVGGWRIAQDSWHELKQRRLSIDFLMGAAALGAAAVGRPLEGGILIFLFSLSKLLETYAMARTRDAISHLVDLRPQEATRVSEDGHELGRVAVEELRPGDRILIRPGERIAADGSVLSGSSEVDQSAMTGESAPIRKNVGDDVFAGTINREGALNVRVTRDAGETMLARIIRLVEEAREQRAPAQHFIDRFAHPYTLVVVLGTVLMATLSPPLLGLSWGDAFYRAMTLLVVASPCALVISTPAAILSGIANGARHGILFKGGAYLDLAGTIDTVAFDKTGTLTEGRPRLRDIIELEESGTAGAAPMESRDPASPGGPATRMLTLAAAVERTSEHHLARAVIAEMRTRGIDVPDATAFVSFPGEGVQADVAGATVWVGNSSMAARMVARPGAILQGWTAQQTSIGRSVVFVGSGGRVLGAMSFGDTLRANALATVRHLKYEGIRWVALISGDHPDAVRAIAAELGVDEVHGGLLPDQKVEVIRTLTASSRGVAMVGDGVNDAPAMAHATIGIAMGAMGTDVAIETADVVLMSDDVEKVDYVIHLGKRARRVVRQNVFFSVGWMLMLVVVALTVGMPLTLAVFAHEGSTLLVAANGLRLLAGRPHPPVVPA